MKRVVITGIGAISPLGITRLDIVAALRGGISAVVASDEYARLNFSSRVSAPVSAELPALDKKQMRFMGKGVTLLYGYHAMLRAVADSGLKEEQYRNNPQTGCLVGTGGPSTQDQGEGWDITREKGPRKIGPFLVPSVMSSGLSAKIATDFGIQGISFSITSACATSAHCIGEATYMIASGRQTIMFAGGSEDCHPSKASGFDAMGALASKFNDNPSVASRAFDVDRCGFVDGAGAGILVLEEYEHAKARNAHIYAEVFGYGATSDGVSMVAPSGEGAERCMKMALAGINPATPMLRVDYINAHGTSTDVGDVKEVIAVSRVFKSGEVPWISSTKSITGHALGAAGALEAIYSIFALEEGFVPVSAHIDTLDPEIEALGEVGQKIARKTIEMPLKVVMSNSFGFGGTNATLVFRKI